MTTISPDRIVELWPTLSAEARQQIVDIAERNGARDVALDLSDADERVLARARDDFKHGRALDRDEYHAEMSAFMQRLATATTS